MRPELPMMAAVVSQNGVHWTRSRGSLTSRPTSSGARKPAVLPIELAKAKMVPAYSSVGEREEQVSDFRQVCAKLHEAFRVG